MAGCRGVAMSRPVYGRRVLWRAVVIGDSAGQCSDRVFGRLNVRVQVETARGVGRDVADAGDGDAFEQFAEVAGVEELGEVGDGRRAGEGDAVNSAACQERL